MGIFMEVVYLLIWLMLFSAIKHGYLENPPLKWAFKYEPSRTYRTKWGVFQQVMAALASRDALPEHVPGR